jgi:thiol-disulfide isomerase/thioredoxin
MSAVRGFIIAGLAIVIAGCTESDTEPLPQSPPSVPPAGQLPNQALNNPQRPVPPVPATNPTEKKADAKPAPSGATTEPASSGGDKNDQKAKPAEADHADPKAADATKTESSIDNVKPDELIAEGKASFEVDELKRARACFEKAIAIDPKKYNEAYFWLAYVTAQESYDAPAAERAPLRLKAAQLIRTYKASTGKLTSSQRRLYALLIYKEAYTLALADENAKAIKSLEEAVESGFPFDQMLKVKGELSDDETAQLTALERLPGYPAFLQNLQRMVEAREKEELAAALPEMKKLIAESKPFPFDFELPDLEGKRVSLASFHGKVTVVNCWGTWCPPCRKELPEFVKVYHRYHARGVEIVGVAFERVEKDRAVRLIQEVIKADEIPYPCLLGKDEVLEMIPSYEGLPTTVFLDRSGKVRLAVTRRLSLGELEAVVLTLLGDEKETPKTGL